jgi:regulator of sirC expression with transglutaminase-like and TPR domain
MPRGKDPEDLENEEPEAVHDFLDFEANHEVVRKLLSVLKSASVHEAMLTLLNACDTLAKAAPSDWDGAKVKQILNDI